MQPEKSFYQERINVRKIQWKRWRCMMYFGIIKEKKKRCFLKELMKYHLYLPQHYYLKAKSEYISISEKCNLARINMNQYTYDWSGSSLKEWKCQWATCRLKAHAANCSRSATIWPRKRDHWAGQPGHWDFYQEVSWFSLSPCLELELHWKAAGAGYSWHLANELFC